MTDTSQSSSTNDKIAALTKEAESLKVKLEEERQKLNDVACKYASHLVVCLFFVFLILINCNYLINCATENPLKMTNSILQCQRWRFVLN